MKTNKILLTILFSGIVFGLVYYSFFGNSTEGDYRNQIINEREGKNQYLKSAKDSPFVNDPDSFKGLSYFDPDPKFRFTADLNYLKKQPRQISTSDGKIRNFLTYAEASFDMGNLRHKLLILEIMDPGPERGKLFLAFTDETSSGETYGSGRYIDLKKVPGATNILLDFNTAYNPYCAYNSEFSCPLPPPENHLKIAVKAGEKSYK